MLWQLFWVFFKVGLISFGGGYAVLTLIQWEVAGRGWLEIGEFQELVSLAGMAPGSIATNAATLIGYSQKGFLGAIIATAGMVLPSLIIIVAISALFLKRQSGSWMQALFYGLRPAVTGLIIYAAIQFGAGGRESLTSWATLGAALICVGCLFGIVKLKLHPIAIILLAAVAGIVLF